MGNRLSVGDLDNARVYGEMAIQYGNNISDKGLLCAIYHRNLADFNCVATCGGHRNFIRKLSAMLLQRADTVLRGRKALIFRDC